MIETPRLTMRPHRLEDFEPWYAMFSHPEVVRSLSGTAPSREEAWNRLLRYAGHWSLLGFGLFGTFETASGAFVGEVGFADFHRGLGERFDGFAEAAWIVAPAAQRKGYATEAMAAAQAWLDAQRGRARTVCIIKPGNLASQRVAAKLGYAAFDTCTYKETRFTMLQRL